MTGRGGFIFLLGLFVLSMVEVFVKAHSEDEHDADEFRKEFGDEPQPDRTQEEHVEVRDGPQFANIKQKPLTGKSLPTLNVSCGYKQAYEQFSMAVRDKYPEMPIEGSNYPPVKWKEYLAHAINILKITAIAAIVSGSNPFQLVGLGEPAIMQWAHSNKVP
ncbi:selT/selW/selH selenoprotein [Ostertagia ostertagi]